LISRKLSENALLPEIFVILKNYRLDINCIPAVHFRMPRFLKKLLFSDSLIDQISFSTVDKRKKNHIRTI